MATKCASHTSNPGIVIDQRAQLLCLKFMLHFSVAERGRNNKADPFLGSWVFPVALLHLPQTTLQCRILPLNLSLLLHSSQTFMVVLALPASTGSLLNFSHIGISLRRILAGLILSWQKLLIELELTQIPNLYSIM